MTILAIDTGVNTGIAISDGFTDTLYYPIKEKEIETKKYIYYDIAEHLCSFRENLPRFLYNRTITDIIIERPFFPPRVKGQPSVILTEALIWEAHVFAYIHSIRRHELSSNTVRSNIIQQTKRNPGETTKQFDEKIINAVMKFGFLPENEHEADAAALICAYHKINHCEGLSLTTDAPHNGSLPKGKSNVKSRK